MRRRAGISGIQQREKEKKILQEKGDEIAAKQIEKLGTQLETFKSSLEKIASEHGEQIKSDPNFRNQFQKMCLLVGVDPLASKKKGISGFLGFGDFYCELGIQIVDICIATREMNGGFIDIVDLQNRLLNIRKHNSISTEDIEYSISQLSPLGGNFKILTIGKRKIIQSMPHEFSNDHTEIMSILQVSIKSTLNEMRQSLGWSDERVLLGLESLQRDGILWVDMNCDEM
ncbi:hypothetical protein BB559_001621, partial [Furculomyces boomerangus]